MALPEPFDRLLAIAPSALRVAVVGATNDARKYGSLIFRVLRARGSTPVPVSVASAEIEGVPAVASLGNVVHCIDFASIVVPPARALEVVRGLPKDAQVPLWFQPGAYDDEVCALCNERGLPSLVGPCLLVELAARR